MCHKLKKVRGTLGVSRIFLYFCALVLSETRKETIIYILFMAKYIGNRLKGNTSPARTTSPRRGVIVGRDYVTVKYRSYSGNRTLKLSKASILAGGRAALAETPVIFD